MKGKLNKNHSIKSKKEVGISSQEFVSIGIACHALCLIDKSGILKILRDHGRFSPKRINKFNNPHLIKAALITLLDAKVICLKKGDYFLTELGTRLGENIGLLTVPLIGYRKLFCNQLQLLEDPASLKNSDIDFTSVALASIDFGKNDLNPLIIDIIKKIKARGTICDLGCGTGEMLVKICGSIKCPGLGIEKSTQVIKESKKFISNSRVEILKGDLTALKKIRKDVDIAIISFLYHDISSPKCSKVLRSFQDNFPKMQYLIVVDIVSPSKKISTILPGFDYVHGLQGVSPRNYEETIQTFKKANYKIFQEIATPNMPNTFVWVLKPS